MSFYGRVRLRLDYNKFGYLGFDDAELTVRITCTQKLLILRSFVSLPFFIAFFVRRLTGPALRATVRASRRHELPLCPEFH